MDGPLLYSLFFIDPELLFKLALHILWWPMGNISDPPYGTGGSLGNIPLKKFNNLEQQSDEKNMLWPWIGP